MLLHCKGLIYTSIAKFIILKILEYEKLFVYSGDHLVRDTSLGGKLCVTYFST